MSTFEDPTFRWRETYFVLFDSNDRPTVTQMERVLGELSDKFEMVAMKADDDGRFESVTVRSPDDFSALDICYVDGDEVLEQGEQLAEELQATAAPDERATIKRLEKLDARLDVLHFQNVAGGASDEDELDEMFDPSALLVVLDALVDLTSGVAVDPQSGSLL